MLVDTQQTIVTAWYESPKLKAAQQAAAHDILQRLPDDPAASREPPTESAEALEDQSATDSQLRPMSGRNPAQALNEMCQARILQSSGYDLLGQSGPSHQPTFTVAAWAVTAEGQTLRTDPAHAASKKAALRAAADQLLDLLVQQGLTRR